MSLGSGSLWNDTIRAHDWLRGNRTVPDGSGGVTDYGSFATVRTSATNVVWFLGQVLDVSSPAPGRAPSPSTLPHPVLGVALSTGNRVWWVTRVTAD